MLRYQLDTTVIYVLKWRPGDVSNSETRGVLTGPVGPIACYGETAPIKAGRRWGVGYQKFGPV